MNTSSWIVAASRRQSWRAWAVGAFLFACACGARAISLPPYTIAHLGWPGTNAGSASEAHAINQNGWVVGTWWDGASAHGSQYAFRFANGSSTNLGTIKSGGYDSAVAYAVNNAGQIVGQGTTTGAYVYHAFLYTNGAMTDLDTTGQSWSSANAINQQGQVAGEFTTSLGLIHAFMYTNGTMQDLGTLPGGTYSSAKGINDPGIIVGESSDSSGNTYAFVYSNNVMTSLGTLGGNFSSAAAINNSGIIAGQSSLANGETHAFVFRQGVMSDLGTFGGTNSVATAINNSGQIAGYALTASQQAHAFLYKGSTLQDLHQAFSPPAGWTNIFLTLAYGINDLGAIAGGVNYISGGLTNYEAFVLSPLPLTLTLAPPTNKRIQLTIQGFPGLNVVLLSSADLVHWTPRFTNLLSSTSIDFMDPVAATNAARFYRARILP